MASAWLAVIREDECIGCGKCIPACPVDAIIGAPKHMHTVIADECIGCCLCVSPCPVDCIDLVAVTKRSVEQKQQGKRRIAARKLRLGREEEERRHKVEKPLLLQDEIKAAVERVRLKKR